MRMTRRRFTGALLSFLGTLVAGLPSRSLYGPTAITPDMLMDSQFDMEAEIMADAARAFAEAEGKAMIADSGQKAVVRYTLSRWRGATFLVDLDAGPRGILSPPL